MTAPTLPSLGAAAAKAPVTLARRVQPAPVAKDSDDDDDLDIQASTKSLKDAPVEPPPPPGSRITVRFSDGVDYGFSSNSDGDSDSDGGSDGDGDSESDGDSDDESDSAARDDNRFLAGTRSCTGCNASSRGEVRSRGREQRDGGARPAVISRALPSACRPLPLPRARRRGQGGGLLELGGMAPASTVNRVRIWRPMLPHDKADVYAYAHAYGVPYFKDTTPQWSTRGKLRARLLPLLEEVYGDGFAGHLSGLARESSQCAELLEAALFAPFLRSGMLKLPSL